ncbi:MAG: peptidoglycan-binding protein [Clostridia bacterium]|nr:peptidoglycan-binding protein [Clostridia bacterium]
MKHRRLLKAALAALLILLPLILSGCYVAPSELPANNSGGDSLNFPTYQPATNPPTNAPVVTSTDEPVVINQLNTAIPLPTSPTVNTWTIATVAPISTDGGSTGITVATVTPLPYTPTPSPTPQGSLKLGSNGQDVRNVQSKLKALGFYKGTVDGDFGAATEAAVKAFQKQYKLTVDGKVGPSTLKALASARATAKPVATATPKKAATPKRTATPRRTSAPSYSQNTYLRLGSKGTAVRQMQERLISLGYLTGSASGTFDEATEAAVIAFQKRNTSYADGVAGPETLRALYSSSARKTSTAAGIVGNSLRPGANGAAVRTVQRKLKELGYYKGDVDGDYGEATTAAVQAFQRANGLTADGIAGSSTFAKLYSSSAKTARQAAATATPKPTRRPTATPRRTPTPLPPNTYMRVTAAPNGDYATLRRGYTGSPVTRMQQELKKQGYYTGNVDGVFGEGTENAVKAFQRSNGLNTDGVAGPATLRALFEGNFPFGS